MKHPVSISSPRAAAIAALTLACTLLPAPELQAQIWTLDVQDIAQSGAIGLDGQGRTLVGWTGNNSVHYARLNREGQLVELRDLVEPEGARVKAITADALDRAVIAGSVGTLPAITVVDQNGTVAWSRRPSTFVGAYAAVKTLANGDVLACGYHQQQFALESLLARYDANGNVRWQQSYARSQMNVEAVDIAETPSGDLLVLHDMRSTGVVECVSPTGQTRWQMNYDAGYLRIYPRAICATPDGGFYFASVVSSKVTPNDTSVAVVRCDANGNVVWNGRYKGFPSQIFNGVQEEVDGMVLSPDGGVAVLVSHPVGLATGVELDVGILLVDSTGDLLSFPNHGIKQKPEGGAGIAALPDGGFVLGYVYENQTMRVARTDPNGQSACTMEPDIFASDFETITVTNTTDATPVKTILGGNPPSVTSQIGSVFLTQRCANLCKVLPTRYGAGTPGTGGQVPDLDSDLAYCVGGTPELVLDNARGGAEAAILFAAGRANLPLFGGSLLVDPTVIVPVQVLLSGGTGVAGAGEARFRITADLTPYQGFAFTAQAIVLDPAATAGVALSAAIESTIQ